MHLRVWKWQKRVHLTFNVLHNLEGQRSFKVARQNYTNTQRSFSLKACCECIKEGLKTFFVPEGAKLETVIQSEPEASSSMMSFNEIILIYDDEFWWDKSYYDVDLLVIFVVYLCWWVFHIHHIIIRKLMTVCSVTQLWHSKLDEYNWYHIHIGD